MLWSGNGSAVCGQLPGGFKATSRRQPEGEAAVLPLGGRTSRGYSYGTVQTRAWMEASGVQAEIPVACDRIRRGFF